MTRRQADCLLIGYVILYLLVIAVATYLTWRNRTKPSPFVPPTIWRELYTGGAPPREFDI